MTYFLFCPLPLLLELLGDESARSGDLNRRSAFSSARRAVAKAFCRCGRSETSRPLASLIAVWIRSMSSGEKCFHMASTTTLSVMFPGIRPQGGPPLLKYFPEQRYP